MRSFFFICATSSSHVKIILIFFRKYGFAIDLTTLLIMERERIPNRERRIESGLVRHTVLVVEMFYSLVPALISSSPAHIMMLIRT